MSVAVNFSHPAEPASHLVQLYGDDHHLLARNVTWYLGEGLRRGDGLLVIATASHCYEFARQLRDQPAYQVAVRDGRIAFFDAEIMLSRFIVDGTPDRDRFDAVVGAALRSVRGQAGAATVRGYGEMVGLLWAAGRFAAAIELEECWNALLASQGFTLYCAYPIDLTARASQAEAVDALLCAHTHLVAADGDLQNTRQYSLQ